MSECDCEALIIKRYWPTRGCCAMGGGEGGKWSTLMCLC